jgi:hypothetical protein
MLSMEILDKKCEHRATVDLVDEKGRRATGGKLTVEARLREPLTGTYINVQKLIQKQIVRIFLPNCLCLT